MKYPRFSCEIGYWWGETPYSSRLLDRYLKPGERFFIYLKYLLHGQHQVRGPQVDSGKGPTKNVRISVEKGTGFIEESWLSLRRINVRFKFKGIFNFFFFFGGNIKALSSICRFLGAVNWFYFPTKRICITILEGWGLDASQRKVHLRAPPPL